MSNKENKEGATENAAHMEEPKVANAEKVRPEPAENKPGKANPDNATAGTKVKTPEKTNPDITTTEKRDGKAKKDEVAQNQAPAVKTRKRSWFSNIGLGQEKDYFIENLSMLLASGMNITSALDAIKGGLKTKTMKNVTEELKVLIDDGSPVWKALDSTGLLSEHAISLIKIGEESGRLPANLKVISIQNQKERMFRSKIASALMYPVAVLFMTLVIGIGISWFILPKLAKVFDSLRLDLPITTKILIAFGNFLGKNGQYVIPAFLIVLFFLFYFIFIFKRTRHIGQKIIFNLPGIKVLVQQIELARFGFILGNLLEAGMPLVDALDSLKEVSTFVAYQKLYIFLRSNVEEGNSFQKCFSMYSGIEKLIPYPVQQMIVTSEQSGSLKETLLGIGEMYEEKTDISTKNLATILEPVLLFIIWLAVLFVALSVIMPIYNLIGGFNK